MRKKEIQIVQNDRGYPIDFLRFWPFWTCILLQVLFYRHKTNHFCFFLIFIQIFTVNFVKKPCFFTIECIFLGDFQNGCISLNIAFRVIQNRGHSSMTIQDMIMILFSCCRSMDGPPLNYSWIFDLTSRKFFRASQSWAILKFQSFTFPLETLWGWWWVPTGFLKELWRFEISKLLNFESL